MRVVRLGDVFTPDARIRWGKMSKRVQKQILDNGFCDKCIDVVTILLETAKMDGKDLILRGKCHRCGTDVCRVVEPVDE